MDQRLMKYVAIGHTARVTNLLQNGACAHAENNAALKICVEKRFINVARKLLEYGADPNVSIMVHNNVELSLLVYGIINVDAKMVALLLEHGADVHANNNEALRRSVKYERRKDIEKYLHVLGDAGNIPELTPGAENLFDIMEDECLEIITVLLEHGADIHVNDDEPLRTNILTLCPKIIVVLLEHGADVHANDDEALRSSVKHGHTETVQVLLEHGANVCANNDEALRTSYVDNPAITKLLIAYYDYGCPIFNELLEDFASSLEIKKVNIYSYDASNENIIAGTIYFCDKLGVEYFCDKLCEEIINVTSILLERGGNIHVANDSLLKFLKENFHEGCDADPNLNLLRKHFYERLAGVLLPYCGETDYQYFDPAYIARKIKPTKNSRTELIY